MRDQLALHTMILISSTLSVLAQNWLQTLGRLHVVVVHFPIALLLIAGVIEGWRAIRRAEKPSPTALMCVVVGGIFAILASGLGWIHKWYFDGGTDVQIHQWLGIAAAGTALAAILVLGLPNRRRAVQAYRWVTMLCALLVALAGHFGGDLTHGDGYLTALIFPNLPALRSHFTDASAQAPDDAAFLASADVRAFFAGVFTQHNRDHASSSERFARCLLLTTPPRLDANESTDKGYINQLAVLINRATEVERLYQTQPDAEVILLS